MNPLADFAERLTQLQNIGQLRRLPELTHQGRYIEKEGRLMLNLSSNDYLGLANNTALRQTYRTLLHLLPVC